MTTPKPTWAGKYGTDYQEVVESWGHEVLSFDTIGSYQGDHIVLLRDGAGRYGIVVIGYGSCSGCDALQSIEPYGDDADWTGLVEFSDSLERDIRWFGRADEAAAYLEDALEHPDGTGWYLYDEEAKSVLAGYRDRLSVLN